MNVPLGASTLEPSTALIETMKLLEHHLDVWHSTNFMLITTVMLRRCSVI
jgi:hypothetical protein